MELYFVTGNTHKFREAKKIIGELDGRIELKMADCKGEELRSESCEEVAKHAAKEAFRKLQKPLFVEDAGLFIPYLKGFPGAFSAYVFQRIGNSGLLKLLMGAKKSQRKAYFESVAALADGKKGIKTFRGITNGNITRASMGKAGFGFDPIFKPEGENFTFAQKQNEKNKMSHRRKSLEKMVAYLKKM